MSNESQSTGWVKEGGFWVYNKPLSDTEQMNENIRHWKKVHADWRKRIGEEAWLCPECGSGNYSEWLIGWWPDDEHYHDPNRKACGDCGHWWWIVCPTCNHNSGRTKESYDSTS
jgi:hypothetical protein